MSDIMDHEILKMVERELGHQREKKKREELERVLQPTYNTYILGFTRYARRAAG
jgi:hypothetical protein